MLENVGQKCPLPNCQYLEGAFSFWRETYLIKYFSKWDGGDHFERSARIKFAGEWICARYSKDRVEFLLQNSDYIVFQVVDWELNYQSVGKIIWHANRGEVYVERTRTFGLGFYRTQLRWFLLANSS